MSLAATMHDGCDSLVDSLFVSIRNQVVYMPGTYYNATSNYISLSSCQGRCSKFIAQVNLTKRIEKLSDRANLVQKYEFHLNLVLVLVAKARFPC